MNISRQDMRDMVRDIVETARLTNVDPSMDNSYARLRTRKAVKKLMKSLYHYTTDEETMYILGDS